VTGRDDQLGNARALAVRWLPPRRPRDRRASLGLVLALAQAAGVDEEGLRVIEVEYLVEELFRRGRKEDRQRVTSEDLCVAGLDAG
jgi:hypothetical protein